MGHALNVEPRTPVGEQSQVYQSYLSLPGHAHPSRVYFSILLVRLLEGDEMGGFFLSQRERQGAPAVVARHRARMTGYLYSARDAG